MLGSILSSIGGAIGTALGGGIFSKAGRFAGKWLGDYLENEDNDPVNHYKAGRTIDNFYPESSVLGSCIPLVFGQARVAGRLIWAMPIREIAKENTETKYFNSGKHIYHQLSYHYYATFALAMCEGEISELGRVWINNKLVDLGVYNHRLYKGNEEQLPNPAIAAQHEAKTPAFRDLCYIVFEDFPLAEFNNNLPSFSFEIFRKPNIQKNNTVENLVESIVIIPGSGEFVYDTIIQYKNVLFGNEVFYQEAINCHNSAKVANSLYSLDQLQRVCPNVQWAAPVVTWFGTSIDLAKCEIVPAVEYNDANSFTSEEWKVANFNRNTARLISRDKFDSPNYGGTVNDASIIRYLDELKNRGLKIMFYPMFFLDVPGKPWRGHLTGGTAEAVDFFNKKYGYKNFILHYATLVKDKVDSFVIGSELKSLTKIRQGNSFPVVAELIDLAIRVKSILGPNVKITYAADWSEYHHTDGGWYNLDDLWAHPAIDFIGIDNYFPVTRSVNSFVNSQQIIAGFNSGNGYDFYIDDQGNKQPLPPAYAWKNIKWWWENVHINPDGRVTHWQPRLKKIWFTEFGYPSVDKAPNQPNVFYDPQCVDGNIPIYSSGETDFAIQRRSIKAAYEYWATQHYIEHMFLWTWDARPYPAWPHMNIWRDNYLWEKGHWVNNKFGIASLGNILLELSNRAGLNIEQINIASVDESLNGLIFNKPTKIWEAINLLRCAYFFDVVDGTEGSVNFTKRGESSSHKLSVNSLVKFGDSKFYEQVEISDSQKINKLAIYYLDSTADYQIAYNLSTDDYGFSNQKRYLLKLPIVFSAGEVRRISNVILTNIRHEHMLFSFNLPMNYLYLQPADILYFSYDKGTVTLRIIEIIIKYGIISVVAVIEHQTDYYLPYSHDVRLVPYTEETANVKLLNLSLPVECLTKQLSSNAYYLYFTNLGSLNQNIYVSLNGQEYSKLTEVEPGGRQGKLINYEALTLDNNIIYTIDINSSFTVFCASSLAVGKADLFSSKNIAMVGNELIAFGRIEVAGDRVYKISQLIRGLLGSENYVNSHVANEDVYFLQGLEMVQISEAIDNHKIYYKVGNVIEELNFKANSSRLPSPIISSVRVAGTSLYINWIARSFDEVNPPNLSYKITVELQAEGQKVMEFDSTTTELMINLTPAALSGVVKIGIVAISRGWSSSNPSFYQLSPSASNV